MLLCLSVVLCCLAFLSKHLMDDQSCIHVHMTCVCMYACMWVWYVHDVMWNVLEEV